MKNLFKYYSDEKLEERCGLILKDDTIVELENIHPNPEQGFEIDSSEVLRYLEQMKATWHTHPNQSSILSGEDHLCFSHWADLQHHIIGKDGISTYEVQNGAVLDANHTAW